MGFAATVLGFETATLIFVAVIAVLAIIGIFWTRTGPIAATNLN